MSILTSNLALRPIEVNRNDRIKAIRERPIRISKRR